MAVKLYELTIRPSSGFGTSLKGDTLFGHFCWQAFYDGTLLEGGFEKWIACYKERPFAVFSSAWPKFGGDKTLYAMKTPDLPLHYLFPPHDGEDRKARMTRRKEDTARKWMLVGENLSLAPGSVEYVPERRLAQMAENSLSPAMKKCFAGRCSKSFVSHFTQPHNSISRSTMTTGESPFAPFSESCTFYYPETELAVFVLIDSGATDVERVRIGLERMGHWGYGKDASTGKGRFEVGEPRELPLPFMASANACYVLAPTVPEKDAFSKYFFSPFIRFGKHGDRYARSKIPFKNPVVMADEGAVFVTQNSAVFKKPYIGQTVSGTSLANRDTVAQGYSIYLPLHIGGLI